MLCKLDGEPFCVSITVAPFLSPALCINEASEHFSTAASSLNLERTETEGPLVKNGLRFVSSK